MLPIYPDSDAVKPRHRLRDEQISPLAELVIFCFCGGAAGTAAIVAGLCIVFLWEWCLFNADSLCTQTVTVIAKDGFGAAFFFAFFLWIILSLFGAIKIAVHVGVLCASLFGTLATIATFTLDIGGRDEIVDSLVFITASVVAGVFYGMITSSLAKLSIYFVKKFPLRRIP